ncbi:hypothetical protein NQ317_015678 [Molorchus minor]|uniref:Uncharacterized protein n=1 Tax=Molorchus minor TaxID=1323400 RepID=A0ABQ9ITQ7_9CUCU|nr:hypothetical protein NQ317_015678 [Molorchus minor]
MEEILSKLLVANSKTIQRGHKRAERWLLKNLKQFPRYAMIKQRMLQALVNEQEKLVKNSIAQFIGIIGKHEFPDNT